MRVDPQLIRPGTLEVHVGPMFSGKTDILFEFDDQLKYMPDKRMILFKPDTDSPTVGIYSKLRRKELPAITISSNNPLEIMDYVMNYHDIVGIDEGQFFASGEPANQLVDIINQLRLLGKHILVDGLSSDWTRAPFGAMPAITSMPGADIITHRAVCNSCGGPADYTQRLLGGKPAAYTSGEQVKVDEQRGTGNKKKPKITYQARCLNHHELPGTPKNYMY